MTAVFIVFKTGLGVRSGDLEMETGEMHGGTGRVGTGQKPCTPIVGTGPIGTKTGAKLGNIAGSDWPGNIVGSDWLGNMIGGSDWLGNIVGKKGDVDTEEHDGNEFNCKPSEGNEVMGNKPSDGNEVIGNSGGSV